MGGEVSGVEPVSDFLLELRSEEIPARMQADARAHLQSMFARLMAEAGVDFGEMDAWSTPRRLALIVRDLPVSTKAVREETKGPRTSAPEQALEGFLRKTGLTKDELEERDGVWFAVIEKPGRLVRDVLAEAIPQIVRHFGWPKSQRWGVASISTESLRWVRPLSGVVAILGEDLVPCEVGGIASGYTTRGHRFHAPGEVTIGGAHDYSEKLRLAHVIVNHAERQDLIRERAKAAAEAEGLTLVEDEGLVIENAGLTEWPVPLLGRFDEAYLEVPPEVIQLTARTNQKYFVCEKDGKLANAFVCTANIAATDGGAEIVAGNRKVLAARLSDASFFWKQDRKTTLEEQAKKLARITFHEKLGTVADKVERVAKLAEWLASEGIVPNSDPSLARRAAELCKADLVTEMVGEFPELQGLMGGYYARAEGLPDAVADAIRDHYKPVGQGDDVPTAPVTVAVALADKLDTIRSFFAIDEKPTGSKDPFALRRAALGIIQIITANGLRFGVGEGDVLAFFADRLKVQQREAGVRHDLIDAVFALGGEDDLVRLLARVHALQAFMGTEDGRNLLAGYKRAANILKKEEFEAGAINPAPEAAEAALLAALEAAEPRAQAAVEAEDFTAAMAALASLRAPIDAFFEAVMVNDPDPVKRAARLSLLGSFVAAVHKVADFSRIEG
ncbi:glycine--tRNA ligase subunit beta [Novosphingobium sp.]|uniref:glycine--tRNA ligase subunit beta n=1 Tax=Novosphingobium sp. TaxID=1874826 RepID=UPI0035AE4191